MLGLYRRGEFPIIVDADATTEIYDSLVEHIQI
jgi:hypothetical protein